MQTMDTEIERVVAVLYNVLKDTDQTLTDIEDELGSVDRTVVGHLSQRVVACS